MQELKQGTPLQGGKYIIKRVLGQGGFGITYLAEQVSLGREVAIKEFFMKDSCVRDESSSEVSLPTNGSAVQVEKYRKKFLKEACTLAGLDHPNIIGVIDVFEENGTVYYSMPFLPGGSIKELVNKRGKLSETDAMSYARQVAEALQYMHQECRICHYDVKPDNILLDRKGNAVLIDFGISKNYDAQGNETSTTPVGMSEGYAPIEQYQQMVDEFSPASDVYALGATLYYMITGTKPPTAVSRISGEELNFIPGITESIRALIESAMTIGMRNRPSDVDLFLKYVKQKQLDERSEITIKPKEPYQHQQTSSDETVVALDSEKTFTVNGVSFTMTRAEGGDFMMGETEEQGFSVGGSNRPVHKVSLSAFYICKNEVTQGLWQAVMGNNPSHFKRDLLFPVESITWNDCQEFIKKLNNMTGYQFRLPTEAEWEFAARGGKETKGYKFAGSNRLKSVAWYSDNSGEKTWFGYKNNKPNIVASKEPNELGLYDMSGNVYEWCQDWYGDYCDEEQNNPLGPRTGSLRVSRGGSWRSEESLCRVSSRNYDFPNQAFSHVGLRLAIDDTK